MSTAITTLGRHIAVRVALSLTLAVSGLVHTHLYIHGYRQIPSVGTAFLIQGSAFAALALLILAGAPRWLQWAAGLAALGSLVAFAMSRSFGLLGFVEHGWDAPYGPVTLVAEAFAVLLVAASIVGQRVLRSSGCSRIEAEDLHRL
jgi:hypothetical protein